MARTRQRTTGKFRWFEKLKTSGLANSSDGGIDGYGILAINPLVRIRVVFQCKRYEPGKKVTRSQVGDLRNAMLGRADKGILLTTGSFTKSAEDEANRAGADPIELVDGERLVEMFESAELGVTPRTVYDVDENYSSIRLIICFEQ